MQLYLEATPQWAVNTIDQEVTFEKTETPDLIYLKTGTIDQEVLAKTGDDVRIDWGYFIWLSPRNRESPQRSTSIMLRRKLS